VRLKGIRDTKGEPYRDTGRIVPMNHSIDENDSEEGETGFSVEEEVLRERQRLVHGVGGHG